jgi:hypothetical protein
MRLDPGPISEALIASGYTSLDAQAKALGLCRSTTWVITKNKHKLGRLSGKTIYRILTNPQTPAAVRTAVRQYALQRCKTATESGFSVKNLQFGSATPPYFESPMLVIQ